MKTDTSNTILQFLASQKEATPKQIQFHLGITSAAVFRQLKKLQEDGLISKAGMPPVVFYFLTKPFSSIVSEVELSNETIQYLNDNFYQITPLGKIEKGYTGFKNWCYRYGLPVEKTSNEYRITLRKYNAHKVGGLIDGSNKIKKTFAEVFLDKTFYLDFYSIERFGKTRLGSMLLYAKQSQNIELIKEMSEIVAPDIRKLIKKEGIDCLGFIPPTVKRQVQFMANFENLLASRLPKVKIIKVKNEIVIPQKTLSKLADRVENAQKSFFISGDYAGKKILLIDDAIGSGASLNEVARKLKRDNKGVKIIGLALVGSYKGFEVISEV